MKAFFIAIAVIGFLAWLFGIFIIFARPSWYDVSIGTLFNFIKCDTKCIWMIMIGGFLFAVLFGVLASKRQSGEENHN
jgi:hypothetical protein